MWRENGEVIQAAYRAFNAADEEALVASAHPDWAPLEITRIRFDQGEADDRGTR
jgi:hypothetical protein